MPQVVRKGDLDSIGQRPVAFSSDVKVEGENVFRHGDVDSGGDVVNSITAQNAKSYNVFVNNKPVVLKGDKDTGGNTKVGSASKVYIGPS